MWVVLKFFLGVWGLDQSKAPWSLYFGYFKGGCYEGLYGVL